MNNEIIEAGVIPEDYNNDIIKPHVWLGTCKLDNGWSIYKSEILDLIGNPFEGMKLPLWVDPKSSEDDSEEYYECSFPGYHYQDFIAFTKTLKALGIKNQEYIFKSYLKEEDLELGESIYQLKVLVEDEVFVKISQGNWIPSFDNTTLVGGSKI